MQNVQFKIQFQHFMGNVGSVYNNYLYIYIIQWYRLFDSAKSAIFERSKLGTFDEPNYPPVLLYDPKYEI